jgi:hypothetical protein
MRLLERPGTLQLGPQAFVIRHDERLSLSPEGGALQRAIPLHWQLGVIAAGYSIVIGCLSEDDVAHESRALD